MTTPEPYFGATVEGVRALLLDTATEGTRVAARTGSRVDDGRVQEWIEQGAARVSAVLHGYTRLLEDDLVETATTLAKSITELWAAALLWDVTHPERSDRTSTERRGTTGGGGQLGDVLARRAEMGLEDLLAWYGPLRDAAIAQGVDDPSIVDVEDSVGAAHSFPPRRTPNRMTRHTRF